MTSNKPICFCLEVASTTLNESSCSQGKTRSTLSPPKDSHNPHDSEEWSQGQYKTTTPCTLARGKQKQNYEREKHLSGAATKEQTPHTTHTARDADGARERERRSVWMDIIHPHATHDSQRNNESSISKGHSISSWMIIIHIHTYVINSYIQ